MITTTPKQKVFLNNSTKQETNKILGARNVDQRILPGQQFIISMVQGGCGF